MYRVFLALLILSFLSPLISISKNKKLRTLNKNVFSSLIKMFLILLTFEITFVLPTHAELASPINCGFKMRTHRVNTPLNNLYSLDGSASDEQGYLGGLVRVYEDEVFELPPHKGKWVKVKVHEPHWNTTGKGAECFFGSVIGEFAVPLSTANNLSNYESVQLTNETLKNLPTTTTGKKVICQDKDESKKDDEDDKFDVEKYLKDNNFKGENGEIFAEFSNEEVYLGDSRISGDGTGLINLKVNDPRSVTPGCESLTMGSEFKLEDNPELAQFRPDIANKVEYTEENLKACISAIQDKILEGELPLPTNKEQLEEARRRIFNKLFTLPNQEQEFAAAIFTLKGEMAGNISDEKDPLEGLMILKVMHNRKNRANGIEKDLKNCDNSDSACINELNKDSRNNLLDIALQPMQFSMYNPPSSEGNWPKNLGKKEEGQFDNAISILMDYKKIGDIKFEISRVGPRKGQSETLDIDKIYHYHTPGVKPAWSKNKNSLSIAGHLNSETFTATSDHYFFHDVTPPSLTRSRSEL